MGIVLVLAIALPVSAAGVNAAVGWRRSTAALSTVFAAFGVVNAAAVAIRVAAHGPLRALGGQLRADALSAWMLLVLASIALLAFWASPAHVPADGGRRSHWYGVLLNLFVGAMAAAVLAANLGALWVAIEGTTIVTAFLVGHHRTRTSLEAAWKYVVICSAAIAIAFLGTVVLYYAGRHAGLRGSDALDWSALVAHASALDSGVTRFAIGLTVLGFGAKAGLVPLHAWLPDAHSQAPAPVSALMSGVLLSVAFYAVLRYKVIADIAVGRAYLRTLLLVVALATIALAALLLLGQRDYKRMLAYSSMEHIGLLGVGAAAGTRLAIAGVLLHIAGHGLAKTVAFLSAGHIGAIRGSTRISDVRALAQGHPILAGCFGLSVVALSGFPPSALFASEWGIARGGFAAGLGWAVAATAVGVLVAFAATAARTGGMLLGAADAAPAAGPRLGFVATAPLLLGLAALAVLGLSTGPLGPLLTTAAATVAP